MFNKIKISLSNDKIKIKNKTNKTKDLNKITINLGGQPQEKKNSEINYEKLINKNLSIKTNKTINISQKSQVQFDKNIFKFFKNSNFSKLDLHGYTVDRAKEKLISYCKVQANNNNTLHIIVTGLGNKPGKENFFSGKIRSAFKKWIITEPLNKQVHSFYPCKIKHGGLGAYYLRLRSTK